MVTYLAGNRAVGTNAERLALNSPQVSGVGGWKELGRTTLNASNAYIDVTGLTSKRYYMILFSGAGNAGATSDGYYQFGDTSFDGTAAYATRYSANGGSDTTSYVSQTQMLCDCGTNVSGGSNSFTVGYLTNYQTKEKLYIGHHIVQGLATASYTPSRGEQVSKWANTTNSVTRVRAMTDSAGQTWNSGGELVVLGWDPADTHTTNFWQELASVSLTSADTVIDSGSFTSKKYLWYQAFIKQASPYTVRLQANGDTSSNYSFRYQGNGILTDGTSTSALKFGGNYTSFSQGMFMTGFIKNVTTKEKLHIGHTAENNTSGAGVAPDRIEFFGKWANSTAAITSLQVRIEPSMGNIQSGSFLKVWGSD